MNVEDTRRMLTSSPTSEEQSPEPDMHSKRRITQHSSLSPLSNNNPTASVHQRDDGQEDNVQVTLGRVAEKLSELCLPSKGGPNISAYNENDCDTSDDEDDMDDALDEYKKWPIFPQFIDSGSTIQNLLYTMGVEADSITEDGIKLTVGLFVKNERRLKRRRDKGVPLSSTDVQSMLCRRLELRKTLLKDYLVKSNKY